MMRSVVRVSILSLHFPPEPTGNAPYVGSLASGLSAHGMRIRALTGHPHYPEWTFRAGYGQWMRTDSFDGVPVSRFRHYLPARSEGIKRLLSEISFGVRLVFARWGEPDVVLLVSPALFATACAMVRVRLSRRNIPVIVWVQDLYSLGITETGAGGGFVARLMKWVESSTLKSATRIVVIHSRFASFVTGTLLVDPSRVEVIRNWTHLGASPDTSTRLVRTRLGWNDEETVVLHAGNMGGKQGLENVLDAARLADEQDLPLRFVLLGDGNRRSELERQAEGISRVQFVDPVDDDTFQETLKSANILLVNEKPGVSEMSVPSKLTSYFHTGRPVVAATDPGGATASEVRNAGGGVIVQSGKPQQLVDACMSLHADPAAAAAYGASGMRYRHEVLGEDAAISRFARLLREASLTDI
jgi:colanic acid biosynthesis glycosyl transferase WcaI